MKLVLMSTIKVKYKIHYEKSLGIYSGGIASLKL